MSELSKAQRSSGVNEAEQQLINDLVSERLYELFGPGGSFRITLGRATTDDAVFVSTVADTIGHEVAARFTATPAHVGRRRAVATPQEEHEAIWQHVESELLDRRTGTEPVLVGVSTSGVRAA